MIIARTPVALNQLSVEIKKNLWKDRWDSEKEWEKVYMRKMGEKTMRLEDFRYKKK